MRCGTTLPVPSRPFVVVVCIAGLHQPFLAFAFVFMFSAFTVLAALQA